MKLYPGITRRLLCGALLGLVAANALPQAAGPSFYTVEIVVFRSAGDAGALPATTPPPAASGEDVEVTPATADKLSVATNRLRNKNSGFRVLAHVAWTQAPTTFNSSSQHGASAAQLGLPQGISGRVSLERGQYPASLRVDLTIEDGGRRYRIDELRRNVKPNQIQYFDHPAIGVLAVISPATAPSPATP